MKMGTVTEEFSGARYEIIKVFKDHEQARNSDHYLIYKLWKRLRPDMKITWEEWKQMPNFATIIRVRRKIQEDGLWLPTNPEVIKQRKIKAEQVRAWATKQDEMNFE